MDLRYTPAEEQFRADLRTWLRDTLPSVDSPPPTTDFAARRDYDTAWQRRLYDAGYAGINWPTEFGGRGSTPTEHLIFLEETERVHAPYVGCNFVGLLHAGPTLIAEATVEQQQHLLPAILRGEDVWCQGFSEPNAGSDLASMQTRAVRDGDDYIVSGQKIWTSFAQIADYCELLVRTDPDAPKHRGISWLICPMDLSGIEVRPIETALGPGEFSEVFFDEVRVPITNRVGEENDGWRVAMVTFSFERGTAFISELLASMEQLGELAEIAKTPVGGVAPWDDAEIRRRFGRIRAEYDALWALTKRNVSQAQRSGVPGPGGSVFKLYYAEVKRQAGELAFRLLDRSALAMTTGDPHGQDHVANRLYSLTLGIAAGTTQIQKNIVGERILGLPKER